MKYKVTKKQNNSDMCAVCGYNNPFSLKASFYELENGAVVGLTQGQELHQSYPHRMHGGLISALLDESMGRCMQVKDSSCWGVTSEMTTKYRKPVPLNVPLKIVGHIVRETSRVVFCEGFIEDEQGLLLATAKAVYVKIPFDKIINDDNCDIGWKTLTSSSDPEWVDIVNPIEATQQD